MLSHRIFKKSPVDFKGIEYFDNLKYLRIAHIDCLKMIEKLDLSKNSNLEELNIFLVGINQLDISSNEKLKIVNLIGWETSMKTLDFSKNTILEFLSVDSTSIQNIDISKNKHLQSLGIKHCKFITELDVSHNTELEDLCLMHLGIKKVDISHNINLLEITFDCESDLVIEGLD